MSVKIHGAGYTRRVSINVAPIFQKHKQNFKARSTTTVVPAADALRSDWEWWLDWNVAKEQCVVGKYEPQQQQHYHFPFPEIAHACQHHISPIYSHCTHGVGPVCFRREAVKFRVGMFAETGITVRLVATDRLFLHISLLFVGGGFFGRWLGAPPYRW